MSNNSIVPENFFNRLPKNLLTNIMNCSHSPKLIKAYPDIFLKIFKETRENHFDYLPDELLLIIWSYAPSAKLIKAYPSIFTRIAADFTNTFPNLRRIYSLNFSSRTQSFENWLPDQLQNMEIEDCNNKNNQIDKEKSDNPAMQMTPENKVAILHEKTLQEFYDKLDNLGIVFSEKDDPDFDFRSPKNITLLQKIISIAELLDILNLGYLLQPLDKGRSLKILAEAIPDHEFISTLSTLAEETNIPKLELFLKNPLGLKVAVNHYKFPFYILLIADVNTLSHILTKPDGYHYFGEFIQGLIQDNNLPVLLTNQQVAMLFKHPQALRSLLHLCDISSQQLLYIMNRLPKKAELILKYYEGFYEANELFNFPVENLLNTPTHTLEYFLSHIEILEKLKPIFSRLKVPLTSLLFLNVKGLQDIDTSYQSISSNFNKCSLTKEMLQTIRPAIAALLLAYSPQLYTLIEDLQIPLQFLLERNPQTLYLFLKYCSGLKALLAESLLPLEELQLQADSNFYGVLPLFQNPEKIKNLKEANISFSELMRLSPDDLSQLLKCTGDLKNAIPTFKSMKISIVDFIKRIADWKKINLVLSFPDNFMKIVSLSQKPYTVLMHYPYEDLEVIFQNLAGLEKMVNNCHIPFKQVMKFSHLPLMAIFKNIESFQMAICTCNIPYETFYEKNSVRPMYEKNSKKLEVLFNNPQTFQNAYAFFQSINLNLSYVINLQSETIEMIFKNFDKLPEILKICGIPFNDFNHLTEEQTIPLLCAPQGLIPLVKEMKIPFEEVCDKPSKLFSVLTNSETLKAISNHFHITLPALYFIEYERFMILLSLHPKDIEVLAQTGLSLSNLIDYSPQNIMALFGHHEQLRTLTQRYDIPIHELLSLDFNKLSTIMKTEPQTLVNALDSFTKIGITFSHLSQIENPVHLNLFFNFYESLGVLGSLLPFNTLLQIPPIKLKSILQYPLGTIRALIDCKIPLQELINVDPQRLILFLKYPGLLEATKIGKIPFSDLVKIPDLAWLESFLKNPQGLRIAFEKGISFNNLLELPQRNMLNPLLNYTEKKDWKDGNKKISFLQLKGFKPDILDSFLQWLERKEMEETTELSPLPFTLAPMRLDLFNHNTQTTPNPIIHERPHADDEPPSKLPHLSPDENL